jgi:type IV pilus assembly protein PilM
MPFSRKSLGVEISPAGVNFALLGGGRKLPLLERIAFRPFAPGTLRVSLREANVLDPQAFSARLQEAHALLLHKGTRLSLALPDAVGRVLLLDVEGRFKNRSEGLDIIRWKLKKSMPFDLADTHLDYQLLRVRESGEMSLLVALVSRTVIGQFEELFTNAGFTPARIDLTGFNLCRTFEQRLEQLADGGLISFYDNTLGILLFSDGSPEFLRFKELPGALPADNRVFMEINNSLLAYRERFPERIIQKIACIAPPDAAGDFCSMVAEAVGSEPQLLEARAVVKPSDSVPADQQTLFPFTAAIGAALRSF